MPTFIPCLVWIPYGYWIWFYALIATVWSTVAMFHKFYKNFRIFYYVFRIFKNKFMDFLPLWCCRFAIFVLEFVYYCFWKFVTFLKFFHGINTKHGITVGINWSELIDISKFLTRILYTRLNASSEYWQCMPNDGYTVSS
jgi:hypothetical protein